MSHKAAGERTAGAELRRRNQNRGVVLKLHEAAAIHRWLELLMDGRKFDNPIVLAEVKRDAIDAKERLGQKLADIFTAHWEDRL